MKRRLLINCLFVTVATLICGGIVYAASLHDVTSTLGGTAGEYFNIDGTLTVGSVKIGAQGTGGVTFFNGTIVNETTTSGADNPVTFGDNVRIDGRIYRGATAGTADSLPVVVNDNMEVLGNLTVAGLSGSGVVGTSNIAAGAVTQAVEDFSITTQTTTKSGSDYVVADTITMTTGDSKLFCMFSGYGTTDAADQDINIGMSLDGEVVVRTARRGTMGGGNGFLNMTTNAIFDVSAGEHTIELIWNTSAGATAVMGINTLDCIEFKK
jgi:stage V sporulation protein SpoVS